MAGIDNWGAWNLTCVARARPALVTWPLARKTTIGETEAGGACETQPRCDFGNWPLRFGEHVAGALHHRLLGKAGQGLTGFAFVSAGQLAHRHSANFRQFGQIWRRCIGKHAIPNAAHPPGRKSARPQRTRGPLCWQLFKPKGSDELDCERGAQRFQQQGRSKTRVFEFPSNTLHQLFDRRTANI
jgi:hypothetical protein